LVKQLVFQNKKKQKEKTVRLAKYAKLQELRDAVKSAGSDDKSGNHYTTPVPSDTESVIAEEEHEIREEAERQNDENENEEDRIDEILETQRLREMGLDDEEIDRVIHGVHLEEPEDGDQSVEQEEHDDDASSFAGKYDKIMFGVEY